MKNKELEYEITYLIYQIIRYVLDLNFQIKKIQTKIFYKKLPVPHDININRFISRKIDNIHKIKYKSYKKLPESIKSIYNFCDTDCNDFVIKCIFEKMKK